MKDLQDLMSLITKCLEQNNSIHNNSQWFVSFSGHVNRLDVAYYQGGWELCTKHGRAGGDSCDVTLDEDGIQEAFWFITNRL
jgi:hypothetical protein